MTWEEVPAISRNGIIVLYEVLYEPLETYGGQLTSLTYNSTTTSLFLSELEEFTEYNISVRAYTRVGPGPYSEGSLATTLQDSKYAY